MMRCLWAAIRCCARGPYHSLYRAQLRLRCRLYDRFRKRTVREIPIPPAMLRFRVSELLSEESFTAVGRGCAQLIVSKVEAVRGGGEFRAARRVLDFGCGCGRVIAWLIQQYPETEFYGVDIDAEAVEWCSRYLSGRFATNRPTPPLHYESGYFDIVYCLSVFTHLNEEMQDAWLAEIRRVLKPGGILLLTVHGRSAAQGLTSDDVETLRRAGFVHKTTTKLHGIVPDWYQTTWHSEAYIVRRLSPWFRTISYTSSSEHLQDFVVAI